MIKINKKIVDTKQFPDGTQNIRFNNLELQSLDNANILWLYENDGEMFTLSCCVNYLRQLNKRIRINLVMPYIPNARMDRIKNNYDNFALKVFAEWLNGFNFDKVYVLNTHSNVSLALINNVEEMNLDIDLTLVFNRLETLNENTNSSDILVFFPDEGACKRYSELDVIKETGYPIGFGIKKREWSTGEITGYDVIGDVKDKTVIIIDDICSYGGTFYFAGKKLKEMGANDIYLYVSHCENSVEKGKLLTEDSPIKRIFTTDSICTVEHPNIEYVNYYKDYTDYIK